MELIRSREGLARLDGLRGGRPLVLVPTMGALHEGHLSLVERAGTIGPVVVSIFVNPTQFGAGEDFGGYPRDLDRDLELLAPLAPAAVFAPGTADVYPQGPAVSIRPGPRAGPLCGSGRPGHFAGVLTVVAKLLLLVRPQVAVFGRKDAQQCLVVDEMVRDLFLPVRLVDAPTVREADGLAMSSRNAYLRPDERRRALALWDGLRAARELLEAGERGREAVIAAMSARLAATDGTEYAEVRRVPDLAPLDEVRGHVLLAVAARVGRARLIDNLVLQVDGGVREVPLLGEETG